MVKGIEKKNDVETATTTVTDQPEQEKTFHTDARHNNKKDANEKRKEEDYTTGMDSTNVIRLPATVLPQTIYFWQ